jgi:DNA-binding response OmpR family regulator
LVFGEGRGTLRSFRSEGGHAFPDAGRACVSLRVFELDVRSGKLRRHGLKIRLPDQFFQILRALLRPGELVTRDELRQLLWTAATFVDFDVGLNSAVRKLREALDDSAGQSRPLWRPGAASKCVRSRG